MADSPIPRADSDADAHRLRALDRLRDRVEAAAREIERLRAENAELRTRVGDLAAHPAVGSEADVLLAFDDDSDAVRAKIEDFIGTIDRLLSDPTADPTPDAQS